MKPPLAPAARRPPGFTLLEVVIAIAILLLVTVTLYRFLDTTLRAATFSEKSGQEEDALAGLRRLVAAQLAAMPANGNGTLLGMTISQDGVRRDALQMVCPAGNAMLTPDAKGFYQATLDLEERPHGSGRYALCLERTPWTDDEEDDAADGRRANPLLRPSDLLKLMDGVQALEIGYFDARLNGWVDKWTDQQALPNLVRLRLTLAGRKAAYEIVLRVPGGGVTRLDFLPTAPGAANGALNGVPVPPGNGVPANPPSYQPPAPPTYVPQPPPSGVPPPPPNGLAPFSH